MPRKRRNPVYKYMTDYHGKKWEVIRVSDKWKDVAQYDDPGTCEDYADEMEASRDQHVFIAVRDPEGPSPSEGFRNYVFITFIGSAVLGE